MISPIHTFVNIPAPIRKRSVFLRSMAGISTKLWIGDIISRFTGIFIWNIPALWGKQSVCFSVVDPGYSGTCKRRIWSVPVKKSLKLVRNLFSHIPKSSRIQIKWRYKLHDIRIRGPLVVFPLKNQNFNKILLLKTTKLIEVFDCSN